MQTIQRPVHDGELRAAVHELLRRLGILAHRLEGVDQRLVVVDQRLVAVEQRLGAVEQRLSSVEATLQHVATKADLHQALNAQTWKMAGFGVTMMAATFALARYL